MIKSLIITTLIIISMMLGWIVVQTLWRKIFTGSLNGEDVLAARGGCGNCGCAVICKKNNSPKI